MHFPDLFRDHAEWLVDVLLPQGERSQINRSLSRVIHFFQFVFLPTVYTLHVECFCHFLFAAEISAICQKKVRGSYCDGHTGAFVCSFISSYSLWSISLPLEHSTSAYPVFHHIRDSFKHLHIQFLIIFIMHFSLFAHRNHILFCYY